MRIAIIGAGVAGVCSAYELALQGHEVQVFERDTSVGTGASFGSAGLLAPGLLQAQAAGLPAWRDAPRHLGWRWACWRQHRALRTQALPPALGQLAQRSQALLSVWRRELQLEVERSQGLLLLWRDKRQQKDAQALIERVAAQQIPHRVLDAAGCLALEPGLNPETPLLMGLHLPQDEASNVRQLCQALRHESLRLGVQWQFNTEVLGITPGSQPQLSLASGPSTPFDAVLVCAGQGSAVLLKGLGLKLPWAPIYGHTLTATLRQLEAHPELGPQASVMDMGLGVSISHLGQRVRVSGPPELGGQDGPAEGRAMARLHQAAHDWFPGALQAGAQQRWRGARLQVPDQRPLIGPSGAPGVWLNAGHGSWDWTLAAGAAQLLGALLAQRDPGLDPQPLLPTRLR
jgi:D-amino-acid dehydrogenase